MFERWWDVAVGSTPGAASVNEDSVGIDGFALNPQRTALVALRLDASQPHAIAVADGMGGRPGGRTASRIAAERSSTLPETTARSGQEVLFDGVRATRFALDDAAANDSSLAGLGTTVVALLWNPSGEVIIGQVGDSMAYRFAGGYLSAIIRPHRSDDPEHPGRLTRHLGDRQKLAAPPELVALRARPGDRFALCTDGVWELASRSDDDFAELQRSLAIVDVRVAAAAVLELVTNIGADDNATVVILEYRAEGE